MKIFILLIGFLWINVALAQNRTLQLDDAILRARTSLAPENKKALQFIYNTNDYTYLSNENGYEVYVRGGESMNREVTFITLAQANTFFSNAQTGVLQTMPIIDFASNTSYTTTIDGMKLSYNPITKQTQIIYNKDIGKKAHLTEAANGNVAYVDNDNVYVYANKSVAQVTTDGRKNIVYGQSVHRDEFGISKGLFWSGKGNALAFYKMDESMVADYPITDWSTTPASNKPIKYPMSGGISHRVKIGIYHVPTKQTVYLNTAEDDHYLTNIAWHSNEKYIYVAEVNRAQNKMDMNEYDATTGQFIQTLFTETSNAYTEPLHPILFVPNKPNLYLWQTKSNGYNHVYLHDLNSKVKKQLTTGNADVLELKGFDASFTKIYYTQTDALGLTKKLYSVALKGGKPTLLTTEDGQHNTLVSSSGKSIIDNYTSLTTPRIIQWKTTDGKKQKSILIAKHPLAEYTTTTLRIETITAPEGHKINVKLYLPTNHSTTKQYPTIVYWYGGPHAQLVTNSYNAGAGDYWFWYMAQQGYIVIVPDVRGSSNRGNQWEQVIHRNIGAKQIDDLNTVLKSLSDIGIDKKRMGLYGWSFGGFMTTNYLLHHPGVFKAAVAGGPVMDWSLYEIMYTERYMDTPQENPEGYKANNLIEKAGKLKDDLLLIHGLQDPVVVQQHSVNFVQACVSKGIQVDYMIYPGHEHNVQGKDRLHLFQKITDYFNQKLQ